MSDRPKSKSDPIPASRPTVIPAFDVQSYARAVDEDESNPRTRSITITNEDSLEAARLASSRASFAPASGDAEESDPELEVNTVDLDISGYDSDHEELSGARLRARLSPLDRIPVVMSTAAALAKIKLDHQKLLVLHYVNGVLSLEAILDATGIPPAETMRILVDLEEQQIIAIKRRA